MQQFYTWFSGLSEASQILLIVCGGAFTISLIGLIIMAWAWYEINNRIKVNDKN